MKITSILLPIIAILGLSAQVTVALPSSAVGQCSGTASGTRKHPVQLANTQMLTATPNANGYLITLTSMPGGVPFAGFVVKASTGTLTAMGTVRAAQCNSASAMQHTESSAKQNVQFQWTGTGAPPTISALVVGQTISQAFTSTLQVTAAATGTATTGTATTGTATTGTATTGTATTGTKGTKGTGTTTTTTTTTGTKGTGTATTGTATTGTATTGTATTGTATTGTATTGTATTGTTATAGGNQPIVNAGGNTVDPATGATVDPNAGAATAGTAQTGGAAAATGTPAAAAPAGNGGSGLSTMNVGIIVGSVIGVAAFAGIGFMVYRRNLKMINQTSV